MIKEWMILYPRVSIACFSFFVVLISTLVQKHFTDQEHMRALKKRQKEIQKEIKKSKDPSVMQELNAEMLQLTGTMMKSTMKPAFITMIPFLILFTWLRGIYIPLMGSGWIWYYLGFSILISIGLRKALKVA
jgi:uncharacterized membrane protein (DUF106 family)